MIVKVCGLRSAENIKDLIPLRVDMAGFIFYEGSPRYVEARPTDIEFLKQPGGVLHGLDRVGVFVNATRGHILEKAKMYHLNFVQLHGDETARFCEELQNEGLSVIKAFSVDRNFAFRSIVAYEFVCDYLLFDTKGEQRGGNGLAFDWNLLHNYQGQAPFILSGGIGPDSVQNLLNIDHKKFAGIDLNSRFEDEPGLKNIKKLDLFLNELGKDFFRSPAFWKK